MVKYLIETGLMGVYDFVICKQVRKVQDLNLSVTFTICNVAMRNTFNIYVTCIMYIDEK